VKKVILAVSLFCLVFGLVAGGSVGCAQFRRSISGVLPYHEERLTTPGSQHGTAFALELSAGDRLEGSVQQVGPQRYGVVFSVVDPNGKGIYDAYIKGKDDFIFMATIDGYYALTFYSVDSQDLVVKYRRN